MHSVRSPAHAIFVSSEHGSYCIFRCDLGTYSPARGATAASTCASCGPNATTADIGQTSVSACWCNMGYSGLGSILRNPLIPVTRISPFSCQACRPQQAHAAISMHSKSGARLLPSLALGPATDEVHGGAGSRGCMRRMFAWDILGHLLQQQRVQELPRVNLLHGDSGGCRGRVLRLHVQLAHHRPKWRHVANKLCVQHGVPVHQFARLYSVLSNSIQMPGKSR